MDIRNTDPNYWYQVFLENNPNADPVAARADAENRAKYFAQQYANTPASTSTTPTTGTTVATSSSTTTPTQQETITSNIPSWAKQYATDLLGFGAALTYPKFNPQTGKLESGFQPYQGELVAGESDLQKQAYSDLSKMQVSPQTSQATGLTGLAALQAQDLARYNPLRQRQYYRSPTYGQENISSYANITAPETTAYQAEMPNRVYAREYGPLSMGPAERVGLDQLTTYQVGGPERVGAERFGLGAMQEYMSPYMQGVVEQQKRAAVQDYRRQIPGIGAASARVGGRGGTREALLESEARRGLSERMGDIEATGLQQAYQQAASQFGQDRSAQMQAALANQAAQQQASQANLQAALGVQQLGTQSGLQAALANQQAGMQVGQQNLASEQARQQFIGQQSLQAQQANQAAQQQSAQANLQALINQSQFGAGQGMQAQQLNQAALQQAQQQRLAQQQALNQLMQQDATTRAQYGLAGTQLGEQSRQFGAGLGLQGLQQQLAAAGQLGQLGQQQYQQASGILGAQLGAGGQQQALKQQQLASNYQRFVDEMQYPYKQLEFMSNLVRGIPSTDKTTSIYEPSSTFGMIGGILGSGGGLGTLFGGR